jgi:hypothetical protein
MNQVTQNQMRLYDLPSKLLCRVLNVELKVRPLSPLPIQLMCRVNFHRRSRTPMRSTRRSCSCRSRR